MCQVYLACSKKMELQLSNVQGHLHSIQLSLTDHGDILQHKVDLDMLSLTPEEILIK